MGWGGRSRDRRNVTTNFGGYDVPTVELFTNGALSSTWALPEYLKTNMSGAVAPATDPEDWLASRDYYTKQVKDVGDVLGAMPDWVKMGTQYDENLSTSLSEYQKSLDEYNSRINPLLEQGKTDPSLLVNQFKRGGQELRFGDSDQWLLDYYRNPDKQASMKESALDTVLQGGVDLGALGDGKYLTGKFSNWDDYVTGAPTLLKQYQQYTNDPAARGGS